jgi:galactokinase
MTGAGFGCTVNLVRPDAEDALRDAVMTGAKRTGLTPRVLDPAAAGRAGT